MSVPLPPAYAALRPTGDVRSASDGGPDAPPGPAPGPRPSSSTVTSVSNLTRISISPPCVYAPSSASDVTFAAASARASTSMPRPASAAPAGAIRFAALPAASPIAPPASAAVPDRPSAAALSPLRTSYRNDSSAVPFPPSYDAAAPGPALSASDGRPDTVTASSNVTLTRIAAPGPCGPAGAAESIWTTEGAVPSIQTPLSAASDPAAPGAAGAVRSAALPAASAMDPPASGAAPAYPRTERASPARTV